ncbi:STAS domain-containing protein [Saccharothrix saharensis]|uniref:STAS domain-containing protein n=1 Tax=Saccharothrix saharensis TaxID=571190 RepID=UPI00367A95E7
MVGHLRSLEAHRLGSTLVRTIVVDLPDRLQVDLQSVVSIDFAGVHALLSRYATAIEYGTRYRVADSDPEVGRVLRATDTFDLLGDSEDLGALLLAVLTRPVSHTGACPTAGARYPR